MMWLATLFAPLLGPLAKLLGYAGAFWAGRREARLQAELRAAEGTMRQIQAMQEVKPTRGTEDALRRLDGGSA